jgi:maltose alpha-D-glucosyltransferase/alpha-amylase
MDSSADAPDVKGQTVQKNSLLNTVRAVIRLRHENPALHADGPFETIYAEHNKFPFLFRRGDFILAFNPSRYAAEAPVPVSGKVVLSEGPEPAFKKGSVLMAPQTFAAIRSE